MSLSLISPSVSVASTDISINACSGEICFSSSNSQSCDLTQYTQYNVSIVDYSGNLIFKREDIPELSCVIVNELLLPDHPPYIMSTVPFNDFILYNSVTQQIISGQIILIMTMFAKIYRLGLLQI